MNILKTLAFCISIGTFTLSPLAKAEDVLPLKATPTLSVPLHRAPSLRRAAAYALGLSLSCCVHSSQQIITTVTKKLVERATYDKNNNFKHAINHGNARIFAQYH
jgi:hypothetical protein